METLTESLVPLDEAEIKRVIELAQKRNEALSRGRAVFTCTTTEAGAAEELPPFPPACARMEYHWNSETFWQARAWDADGNLLSDTASDGKWVEAGGKRWHINYLTDPFGGDSDDEEAEDRRWDTSSELAGLLWCRRACENHLFMNELLVKDYGVPILKDLLFRDEATAEIVYRAPSFHPTMYCYRYNLWDRVRWWWVRCRNPDLTLDDFLGLPKSTMDSDMRFYFDPKTIQILRSEGWWESPQLGDKSGSEHWLSPIAIEGGFTVASRSESYAGLENATLLRQITLVTNESEISPTTTNHIRSVDNSLPQVDW